jgi:hypothetical protein
MKRAYTNREFVGGSSSSLVSSKSDE